MQNSDLPQITDKARRVARTVIQVAVAFVSFAAVYPLILNAIAAPDGSNVGIWLTTSGVWVATAAGIVSRIMAIPTVNTALAKVRLNSSTSEDMVVGTFGTDQAMPSDTQIVNLKQDNSGEYTGTPAY